MKWWPSKKKVAWTAPEPTSPDEPSTVRGKAAETPESILDVLTGEIAPSTRLTIALEKAMTAYRVLQQPTHDGGRPITARTRPAGATMDSMLDSNDGWGDEVGVKGSCGSNLLASPSEGDMTGINYAAASFLGSQMFIGYQMAAMLSQNWLVEKCCSMPARDAVRNWLEPRTIDGDELDSPDVLKLIRRFDKQLGIKKSAREFITKGRMFGVRLAYFRIESKDPDFYSKPFNADSVKPGAYKGVVQVDPYWCAPELDWQSAGDPSSPDFYEPTFWRIGPMRIHKSHVFIYRHGNVPDMLKPMYMFGGIPLPQLIMDRVYAAERVANEAPMLALSKRTNVLKVDVKKMAANAVGLIAKIAAWVKFRDNQGIHLQDKDDEYQQFDTSLAELSDVIMTSFQLVAAAAETPATKLLQTSPKGFNSTGENEQRNYSQMLESLQENDLTPLVERHHQLVMIAYVVPAMRKKDPAFEPMQLGVTWNPVDVPTGKELADINKVKAETDTILMDNGTIDEYDARERLVTDGDSGYSNLQRVKRPNVDDDGNGEPDERVLKRSEQPAMQGAAPGFSGDARDVSRGIGVELWTNQTYLDEAIVATKVLTRDFVVQVTPVMIDPDNPDCRFRLVIDGHHSLAAAERAGVEPVLVEGGYQGTDYGRVDEVWCRV